MLLTNIPHVSHAARAAGAIWVNVEGTIAASMAGWIQVSAVHADCTPHQVALMRYLPVCMRIAPLIRSLAIAASTSSGAPTRARLAPSACCSRSGSSS